MSPPVRSTRSRSKSSASVVASVATVRWRNLKITQKVSTVTLRGR